MTTFRQLIGDINITKDPNQQSPLELWFESVLDVPIEQLTVEDLCRSIRQKICIGQLMPRIIAVLKGDPLSGEYYDGELIAALSTIKKEDLKGKRDEFLEIKCILNNIDKSNISSDLKNDILKINQLFV